MVVVPGLANSAPFEMDTVGVDRDTVVGVTVRLGGLMATSNVTVRAAALASLALRPNTDERGGKGTISLRGKAGPAGVTVTLTSSDPNLLLPAVLKIAPGMSVGTFNMAETRSAQKGKVVTVTASYGSVSISQPFTLN
jgi:hypothetical protein